MASVRNTTRNTAIAEQARIADSFLARMVGLLDRASLAPQEGLVITHCRSIHMLFMRFAIDILFIDREDTVIGLVEDIKPFRFSPIFFRASYAIEVPVGTIGGSRTALGDKISIQPAI